MYNMSITVCVHNENMINNFLSYQSNYFFTTEGSLVNKTDFQALYLRLV